VLERRDRNHPLPFDLFRLIVGDGKPSPRKRRTDELARAERQRQLRELESPEVSEALMDAAKIGDLEKPISIDNLVTGFTHDEALVPKRRRAPWAIVTSIVVLLGCAAAWRYTPLADVVTADNVLAFTESFARKWWAPLAIILAYTPACMVMFPRPLITLAAVMAFGPWEGLTYSMTGVVLSANDPVAA
jgi:hypothetical protein